MQPERLRERTSGRAPAASNGVPTGAHQEQRRHAHEEGAQQPERLRERTSRSASAAGMCKTCTRADLVSLQQLGC